MKPFCSQLAVFLCGFVLSGQLVSLPSVYAADAILIERVKVAIEKRDFVTAQKDLDVVLALNAYDEAALTQKVRLLYFQDRLTEARSLADMVLKEYPRNLEVLNVRGLLRAASDLKGALEDYDAVLQIDPQYFKTLVNRAKAHYALGRNNAALEDISNAIKIDEKQSVLYFIRATVLEALKRSQEALADYDTAIANDPQSDVLYGNRAALRLSLIKTAAEKEALEMVKSDNERALQLNPKNTKALTTRGWYHLSVENDGIAAFRSFYAAYFNDRNHPTTRSGLEESARQYMEGTHDEVTVGEIWKDACAEFEKTNYDEVSWERVKWASDLLNQRARLSATNAYSTSPYLDSLLAKDPQNVRLLYYRNAGYFRAENDAKLRALVDGDSRTKDARFVALAAIELARSEIVGIIPGASNTNENYKNAISWCKKAIEIVPDLPEAAEMLKSISAKFQEVEQIKEQEKAQETKMLAELQGVYGIYKQWEAYRQSQIPLIESKVKATQRLVERSRQSPGRNDQYTLNQYNTEIKEIYGRINNRAVPVREAINQFRYGHYNIPAHMQKTLNDMSKVLGDAHDDYNAATKPGN